GTLRSLPLLPVRAGGALWVCRPVARGALCYAESSCPDERLPATAGRDPVFRARTGDAAAAGKRDRVRARLGGRGAVRRETALPGGAASHFPDAPGALGGTARRADRRGRGLRHGAVRRGGAARPARTGPAQGGRQAADSPDPWP